MSIVLITSFLAILFASYMIFRSLRGRIKRDDVSLLVDITTVVIGAVTIVVSVISISVMLSQEDTQAFLLEAQKKEHQPVFSINYITSKSPASEVYDVEDFVIESNGEHMLSPASITHKTFIKVDYKDFDNDIQKTIYYPLTYYYNATVSSDDHTGRLMTTIGNEYLQNNLKLYELHKAANAYNSEYDKEYVFLEKIDLFKITYTDIYKEERTNHYRNSYLCTPEIYESIIQNSESNCGLPGRKSISEVSLEDILEVVK